MHVDISLVTDIVVPTTDPIFFWPGSMSGSDVVILHIQVSLTRYDEVRLTRGVCMGLVMLPHRPMHGNELVAAPIYFPSTLIRLLLIEMFASTFFAAANLNFRKAQ